MNEIMSDIGYSDMRSMLKDCLCEIQAMAAIPGVSGISSGFWRLDLLTDGFENGKVYVIGARLRNPPHTRSLSEGSSRPRQGMKMP